MLGCQYNVVVADILTQCKVTFGLCKSAAARSIYSTSILWLHTIRQRRPISSAHFLCNVDFDIVWYWLIIRWQYLLSKIRTYYLIISAEYLYISINIKGATIHDIAGVGDDEAGALPRLVHRPGQPRPLQPGRLRRVRCHRGRNSQY